ncbi:MAG: hypothetical protein KA121_11945 [Ferruginibacter sp.]|nr:hypothetical protein [Ferruginibacter sp.]
MKEFISKFAATNGYPVWNKVLMGTSQKQYAHASLAGNSLDGVTDTTILIPFVMEGEFSVKGFICATLNDSVSLSYSLAKDYKAYEEKLDNSKTASSAFAMLSMALNKIVFNEEYYKITNPKILSTDTAHIATQKIKLNEINFSITDSANMRYLILCSSFTQTQAVCGTPGAAVCSDEDGCDAGSCPTNSCHLVTTTTNICTGIDYPDILGSTGGGSTGEGGGSNGGGPIPYVYPCETTQNNPAPFTATNNIEDPGDCPVPGPGDGWLPWEGEDDFPVFNDNAPPPFIWTFSNDDGTTFTDPNPLEGPDFYFNPADDYETRYPRFTTLVKNLKTFVKENPEVLNALQAYSGFSKQQILEHLTYGQGPTIKVEEMGGRFGYYDKNNGINTLHVRASYVRGLEQSYFESTKKATAFLLAVTILHEYIHLGTTHNNKSEGVYDFGYGFEMDAFNVIVDDQNAENVVIKYSKYF